MVTENIASTSPEGGEGLPITPTTPVTGAPTTPPEGAGTTGEVTTPTEPPKGYSEEEWTKRQSSWDTQMAETTKKHKEQLGGLQTQYAQMQIQLREQEYTKLLGTVEEAGGSPDLMTLTKNVIEQAKTLAQKAGDFDTREAKLADGETQYQGAMKLLAADELVKTHKLPVDARAKLLEAGNPDKMEVLALTMKLEKAEQESKPPTKIDGGGGTGSAIDESKLSPKELFKQAFKEQKQ